MSSKPIQPLTPKEVIEKSGNSFHMRIADALEKQWRIVEISSYYTDFATSVPRELDIIAYRIEKISAQVRAWGKNPECEICVKLFIECKYLDLNNTIVTWTQPLTKEVIKNHLSAKPIIRELFWDYMKYNDKLPDEFERTHQYYNHQSVAKLFSTQNNEDPMFKWINQVLHSLIYFEKHKWSYKYHYNYPVIVINTFNNFYKTNSIGQNPQLIKDGLLFNTKYSYTENWYSQNRDFFIDIVDENWLNTFLTQINNELQFYINQIKQLPPTIVSEINRN